MTHLAYEDADDRLPFAERYDDEDEGGLDDVAIGDECPNCGERNVDMIEWQPDETLRCLKCRCCWSSDIWDEEDEDD